VAKSPAVQAYWDNAHRLLESQPFRSSVARAAEMLVCTYGSAGTVVALGDGDSASTASHFATDLAKYATNDRADFRVTCLNDSAAALAAWTDDASWSAYCERSVATWLGVGGGVLCAFSVRGGRGRGGRTPGPDPLVRAALTARGAGNKVIAFTGFGGGRLGSLADININVPAIEEDISTPLIESLHFVAHQAICLALRTGAHSPTPTPLICRPIRLAA
jgi:D-sedoheptulose 7-phosphate isomerase